MFEVTDILKAAGGVLSCGPGAAGIKGVSIDSRTIRPGDLFVAIKGERFDGHNFINQAIVRGAAAVVCQGYGAYAKNIPFIKVKDTTVALGDIANYHRKRFSIPVIAVTGSNGKTTTKDMLSWILGAEFCVLKNSGTKNNCIGLPLTLLELNKSHDICIVEIGTNHFGEVETLSRIAQPTIGVITNIGPSHLEFLKNSYGVYREKIKLFRHLEIPAIGLINSDDALLRKAIKNKSLSFMFSFGIKNNADFRACDIKLSGTKLEFRFKDRRIILNTVGTQNVYNALAAIAVARVFGLSLERICKRLKNFKFPEGRLKFINKNGVNFIDDTYNSNPLSLDCALDTLRNLKIRGRKIFIMGDMRELGGSKAAFHRNAAFKINRSCDCVITVGDLAKITALELRNMRSNGNNIFTCDSAKSAKDTLFNFVLPGRRDIVLVKGSRKLMLEGVFK